MARSSRVIGFLVLLATAVVVATVVAAKPAPREDVSVTSSVVSSAAVPGVVSTERTTLPPTTVPTPLASASTVPADPPTTSEPIEASEASATAEAAVVEIPQFDREIAADVFIWDTTMQGLGALRGIQEAAVAYPVGQVVIASSSPRVTAMPAQGLGVEDLYLYNGSDLTSGMWREFRRAVLAEYRAAGIRALTPQGRMVTEPRVARETLRWFVDRGGAGRAGTTFVCAHLIDAGYGAEGHWALLKTASGERVLVRARVLVDGSVEGDLARRLGTRYRFGTSEREFDLSTGPPPAPNGDDPTTWIQRMSALLTLQVYSGSAPPVAGLDHRVYDPAAYNAAAARMNPRALELFASSWSMGNVLPNGARELNETWNDYPYDITLPYRYVFDYDRDPAVRARLRDVVLRYSIDRVRYLQENGYTGVGIGVIPDRIYLREGLRVVGRDTYTYEDVRSGAVRQPVAFGRYALYDVHLPVTQDHVGVFVHLPMGSLIAADLDDLLIPGPVSTDHRAYNSAVRTEPVRANAGGAAGVIAAIAVNRGLPPAGVSYEEVRDELLRQGYRLGY